MMTTHDTDLLTDKPAGDDDKDTAGGGMRKQLEKSLARTKELEAKERVRAFKDAGFDTSTGIGKAIARTYDGEADKDAILAFASDEYGHVPAPADNTPAPHPQAAQIAVGQAALDQIGNVAGSVTQTTRLERLAAARASGDMKAEGAIMAAQMQDMMDRQAQPPQ